MNIRVRRKIDSETVQIPELKSLIGKTVEISIVEMSPSVGKENEIEQSQESAFATRFAALLDLAGKDVVDAAAYQQLRSASAL